MKIEERVRPLIFYISIFGLIVSTILLLGYLTDVGTSDAAFASMGLMLWLACMLGCFYKRIIVVDAHKKQLTTQHSLILHFAKRSYSFDEFSTVYVRKEYADTQGADITRQSNTSRKAPLFIVYADLKGFKKGKKRRVCIKKFFEQVTADALAKELTSALRG
jgi:hypothetical protein